MVILKNKMQGVKVFEGLNWFLINLFLKYGDHKIIKILNIKIYIGIMLRSDL